MLQKLLSLSFISICILAVSCAPRPEATRPPEYAIPDLTLEEIIARAGSDITSVKAITDIRIEKNGEPYSFINASVLLRKPDMVHMRMYQLGMLVRDFVVKNDSLYVLSGKHDAKLKTLGEELYRSIFWWESYQQGILKTSNNVYVIMTDSRTIEVDAATLMPLKQNIRIEQKHLTIAYSDQKSIDDMTYPSRMEINLDDFQFSIKVKKLLKNPEFRDDDFRTSPAG